MHCVSQKSGVVPLQTQPPAWQTLPPVHVVSQLPQCAGSLSVFTHALLQLVRRPHDAVHPPGPHEEVGEVQACPHAPQLAGSADSLTQPTPGQSV